MIIELSYRSCNSRRWAGQCWSNRGGPERREDERSKGANFFWRQANHADSANHFPGALGVVVISLAALTLNSRAEDKAPAASPLQPVTVAPVPEREISEWDEFTGRLQAVDQVDIRPRVSGYIQRVAFTEGREVRKGEVLFEIDPRPYQAELDRAQAELERARSAAALAASDVRRADPLVKAQAISREEYDSSYQRRGAGRCQREGRGSRG